MFHLSLHGRLAEVKNKTLHLKAFQRAFQFSQIKKIIVHPEPREVACPAHEVSALGAGKVEGH